MTPEERALIRHLLATAAFRFALAIEKAPPAFAEFDAGREVSTPLALVRHMNYVTGILGLLLGGDQPIPLAERDQLGWSDEVDALYDVMREVDTAIADGAQPAEPSLQPALQGPLADLIHHAGQLAVLRRLAGRPVRRVRFPFVPITPGQYPPILPPPEQ